MYCLHSNNGHILSIKVIIKIFSNPFQTFFVNNYNKNNNTFNLNRNTISHLLYWYHTFYMWTFFTIFLSAEHTISGFIVSSYLAYKFLSLNEELCPLIRKILSVFIYDKNHEQIHNSVMDDSNSVIAFKFSTSKRLSLCYKIFTTNIT